MAGARDVPEGIMLSSTSSHTVSHIAYSILHLYFARQVRETSRKPDELYSLLERLSPGTRKLEIFARQHNCQPGWVGLGNQLTGNNIL